ncbi:SAM-dependent methlyltransferase [Roseivivax halodurans JCM 10272]|uniref:SAM-dependent methlyltransferase n=1 Tax=Roseivivax halodurans JCM 10272 TaxID=1449350 RepID=X7ECV4_9RHOB|nr:class I SAM-dependent methyltransferase [Roseivivax halodurans]ETX13720.1 SAM-dependent methlyltransferase [Roseivivax halodurans JCM 10272]
MDTNAVETSYARWAPIYDRTFGAITDVGRRRAVEYVNHRGGAVLEVGVGTGLALPHYRDDLEVTGVDYSEDMLGKARDKVDRMRLTHVRELRQMDAREIDYPDAHFDTVVAMHVLSVVPDPETVMSEIARVCKPGGEVVVVNHFKRTTGVLAMLERGFAPFANYLGWHSDFSDQTVLGETSLSPVERKPLPPFGMMTFMTLRKAG